MTSSNLEIRAYEAQDNAALTEIWHDASIIAHSFLGAETLLEHRRLVSDVYLPQAETWVACLNGAPVGFIGLMENFMGGLFVAPEAQGRGVGPALVRHGPALKGVLHLDVYARNARTVRFYRRMGFEETERRPTDKAGLPFEEISMTLGS